MIGSFGQLFSKIRLSLLSSGFNGIEDKIIWGKGKRGGEGGSTVSEWCGILGIFKTVCLFQNPLLTIYVSYRFILNFEFCTNSQHSLDFESL